MNSYTGLGLLIIVVLLGVFFLYMKKRQNKSIIEEFSMLKDPAPPEKIIDLYMDVAGSSPTSKDLFLHVERGHSLEMVRRIIVDNDVYENKAKTNPGSKWALNRMLSDSRGANDVSEVYKRIRKRKPDDGILMPLKDVFVLIEYNEKLLEQLLKMPEYAVWENEVLPAIINGIDKPEALEMLEKITGFNPRIEIKVWYEKNPPRRYNSPDILSETTKKSSGDSDTSNQQQQECDNSGTNKLTTVQEDDLKKALSELIRITLKDEKNPYLKTIDVNRKPDPLDGLEQRLGSVEWGPDGKKRLYINSDNASIQKLTPFGFITTPPVCHYLGSPGGVTSKSKTRYPTLEDVQIQNQIEPKYEFKQYFELGHQ